MVRGPEGAGGGARPVHGEGGLEGGPLQLPLPEAEEPVQFGAAEALPLPRGEVGVLDPGLGEGGGCARPEGAVQGGQLPQEEPGRPLVLGDVVQGEGQDVVPRPDARQERPEREVAGQVEGALRVGAGAAERGVGRVRLAPEVHLLHGDRRRGVDHLDGPVLPQPVGGPQHLVAP